MLCRIILSVFLATTLADFSLATTYYVKPSGNDYNNGRSEPNAWQHISRACTTLVAGDTVLIRAGTYNENSPSDGFCGTGGEPSCGPLTPKRSGSAGNYIVYNGYPGERPIIKGDQGGDYDDYAVCIYNKSYIVLDSLIITESYRGVMIKDSHNITVKNCKVFDTGGPPDGDNTAGIFFCHEEQIHACTVQACTTYDNKLASGSQWNASGIGAYNMTDCLIEDNVVHQQTGGMGIRLKGYDTTCVVRNNVVHDCNIGIFLGGYWCYANEAYENIVYDCDNGMYIDNEYSDNNYSKAWNNTIYNCDDSGIKLVGYQGEYDIVNCSLWNNIVMNCSGAYEEWTAEMLSKINIPTLYSDYNCFYDAGSNNVVMWDYGHRYTLAGYVAITNDLDENSIQQNPLFINASNHDFHLQENSPCRGMGLGGVDMGAYPNAGPDTTGPIISNVAATNITSSTATIIWTTNEPATSQVEYGLDTGYGDITTLDPNLVTSHSQGLTGLSPDTEYHYRVRSRDSADNESVSSDFTFRTLQPDSTAPVISNVQAIAITSTSAIIIWTTDEPATSQVEYGLDPAYGSTTNLDSNLVTNHSVGLAGLQPNTTYHFRVFSSDADGNQAFSPDDTFTTLSETLENLALGITPEASGTYQGYTVIPITDGAINPYGGTNTTWSSDESATLPHWVEIDFQENKSVEAVVIYWAWNSYEGSWMTSREYRIQSWSGPYYNDVFIVTDPEVDSMTIANFTAVVASRIRIYQPANMGPIDYSEIIWLTELEIYGTEAAQDTIPPAAIDDLHAIPGMNYVPGDNLGEVILSWTASGDDDTIGMADHYVIKYSTSPIYESNWDSVSTVLNPPSPLAPGDSTSFTIDSLVEGQICFVAIKTYDEVGNGSDISNVPGTFACGIMVPTPLNTEIEDTSVTVTSSLVESYMPIYYLFALDSLEMFPNPRIEPGLMADTTVSAYFDDLSYNVNYFWRCCAISSDSIDWSDWSPIIEFNLITGLVQALNNSDCVYPTEGEIVNSSKPVFTVRYVPDIENIFFQVDNNSQFNAPIESGSIMTVPNNPTNWQITEPIEQGVTYCWRVSSNNIVWTSPISFSAVLDIHPYPNPFRASEGHSSITFTNLPQNSNIIISTISGEIVLREDSIGPVDWIWDVKNEKGNDLAPGVYLYMIDFPSGSSNGKVMVIR